MNLQPLAAPRTPIGASSMSRACLAPVADIQPVSPLRHGPRHTSGRQPLEQDLHSPEVDYRDLTQSVSDSHRKLIHS